MSPLFLNRESSILICHYGSPCFHDVGTTCDVSTCSYHWNDPFKAFIVRICVVFKPLRTIVVIELVGISRIMGFIQSLVAILRRIIWHLRVRFKFPYQLVRVNLIVSQHLIPVRIFSLGTFLVPVSDHYTIFVKDLLAASLDMIRSSCLVNISLIIHRFYIALTYDRYAHIQSFCAASGKLDFWTLVVGLSHFSCRQLTLPVIWELTKVHWISLIYRILKFL